MQTPLTKNEANRIKIIAKEQFNIFLKTHFLTSKEMLTRVLKSHLYIESLINDIIRSTFPYPDKLLKKNFDFKIDLLQSTGPSHYQKVILPLKTLNNIRNKFAHNLDYKPNKEEINSLIQNLDISEKDDYEKINRGIIGLIGYLQSANAVVTSLPYLMTCLRNNELFEHDQGFNKKEIINKYGVNLTDFFKGLKFNQNETVHNDKKTL